MRAELRDRVGGSLERRDQGKRAAIVGVAAIFLGIAAGNDYEADPAIERVDRRGSPRVGGNGAGLSIFRRRYPRALRPRPRASKGFLLQKDGFTR